MAQTGYTPILIYSSSTTTNAPSAGNLTNSTLGSELAINITDGKLFYKDNANAVQVIAWKVTPTTAGGTGLTSYSQGDLLYYNSGTTLTALAKNTSATRYLSNTGSSNNPAWAQVDLTNGVTGTLPVANGGTGTATTFTAGSVIFAGASGIFSQDNANLFWDDTNNLLGVGTATPDGVVTIPATNSNTPRVRFQHPSNNADASIDTYQDGGGTYLSIGTNAYQSSGGSLTKFDSGKAGGLAYFDTSGIILFYTATAAGSFTEQLRIGTGTNADVTVKTGNLVVGTSGKGIDFSATASGTGTMTSELFSDYEEGTFTPTIASGATSISYTTQSGYYTKIGRVVQFQINLNISTSTLDGNQLKLGGLPFTCGADFGGAYMVGANSSFENVTTAPRALWRIASSGTTVDAFYTNNVTYKGTDMSGVNPVIRVVGSYIV